MNRFFGVMFPVFVFLNRQADKQGGKDGENIGLNKSHKEFDKTHKNDEKSRYGRHIHRAQNKNQGHQADHNGVPGQNVGKQTHHQGKGLGEHTQNFDGHHNGP